MKKLILMLFFAATAALMFSSCSKKNDETNPSVKNYLLVHGAWEAPYVFDSVKASLIKDGNNVTVVQLPGHGSDATDASRITLNLYRDKVIDAMTSMNGKVILVGHSLGGMIISAVAEQVPTKVEKLVYLAAYLPTSGQSLFGIATTDAGSHLTLDILKFSADHSTVDIEGTHIVDVFIQDGSTQAQNLVLNHYKTEPAQPLIDTVALTSANFGSVAKAYIKTLQDHTISPDLQNEMINTAAVKEVYQLNAGHCASITKADSLAILLKKIGQ
ncbi:alpha/beta fold hydrolase [Chitinophaga sp. S165]|uniref:alpha/beta fold hydrolase n=1 Tax=Chitinophaga sp. S165 TaxID=2135462 RepID=UPI000D7150D4|nr:alpha/beta fold hydrolase [Chitinophaga sp. S165]PWV56831.1 pimeloyl-ACP methyl ester carboxylesterase [Chitinophaga sp. S165]